MNTLERQLESYLAIRRGLGFRLSTEERILRRFVDFLHQQKARHITVRWFLKWKETFGHASQHTWSHRAVIVRIFAQWLSGIDPRHEVLPKDLIPGRARRGRPYIYSDQEIARIVEEAERLRCMNGIRGPTFATFFGLIAVTGLRISEALALNNDDVDLDSGVLTIRQGKSGKQRLAPLTKSTVDRLRVYVKERDRLLGYVPQPFFVGDAGERPDDCSARYNFAVVCQRIGLRAPQKYRKHGRGPRIHDLRHTFAVRTMMDWYRSGKDPDREMVRLSTYLGHTKPASTYWYIEAVPELLKLASDRATRLRGLEGGR